MDNETTKHYTRDLSQSQKATYCIIAFINRVISWLPGVREVKMRSDANGYRIYYWGDENDLKLDCGDSCTTLGAY
jgi:hypothetical protein